jgi:hypothetical protein
MDAVGAVTSPKSVEEVVDKGIMDLGVSLFRQMVHESDKKTKELNNETQD